MFRFGKKTVGKTAVVIPAPVARHYDLTEQEQEALVALESDKSGFVAIGDVTHGLLHQQPQYITCYMDGRKSNSPVLVGGLRVDVSSSTYHEYRIHQDDVVEFVARVRAWQGR